MKLLLIFLTVLSSFTTKSSLANDGPVNNAVLQVFQNSFAGAKEVYWTVGRDYYKADFQLNGQYVSAFISREEKLVAITKHISSTQLPFVLQAELKKSHANAWISELFEISNEEGIAYYVTLETADSQTVLKSSGNYWNLYSKKSK
ncbi:MAG TPA: hypothetical protein VEY32_06115 [Flavisolibacter sp.]|jgi:hypothetical protein|nr:hypothetical protein [Chitinophagaceae bacterium]HZH00637.1 hypothetical protein [Flavisolibacter sp.]